MHYAMLLSSTSKVVINNINNIQYKDVYIICGKNYLNKNFNLILQYHQSINQVSILLQVLQLRAHPNYLRLHFVQIF